MTRHQVVVRLSALLLAAAQLSCGIRGRPLPPLVIVPAVVSDLSAVRLGNEVHLHFTIPEANADGSQPPDISRVDIFAVTTLPEEGGAAPVLDEWLESADPIFTFEVVVPEEPVQGDADRPEDGAEAAAAGEPALAPGDPVTVIEELTPDAVEPVRIEPEEDAEEEDEDLGEDAGEEDAGEPVLAGPLLSPPLPRAPRRTYIAVAVSQRNRQSAAATAPPVPVQPAPDPPGRPVLTYTETVVTIEWSAPETARLPVQAPVPAVGGTAYRPTADSGTAASEPADNEPAETEPAETEPAETEPAETEPAETEPAETEPVETEPVETEPAETEPAETEPVETEPIETEPIETEPIETEPAQTEPAETEPVESEPAASEPAETYAAESEPAVLSSVTLLSPQTPSRYDVYDVSPPTEAESEEGGELDADDTGIPRPLNDQPLAATSHTGVDATLGVERCFLVRTVDAVDPIDRLALRSAASETTCLLLVDMFPPAAPAGLVAIAAAGAISLTWTTNAEADVAGYMVLRGRGPDGELEALTPEPIAVTNYRDTTVETGVSYVYAVQALDGAEPPNVSPASEPVTEQVP